MNRIKDSATRPLLSFCSIRIADYQNLISSGVYSMALNLFLITDPAIIPHRIYWDIVESTSTQFIS